MSKLHPLKRIMFPKLAIMIVFYLSSNQAFSQSQVFNVSSGFNVPAGVSQVKSEAWGAGGGGSTITANGARGGGGGGGAYASGLITVIPSNNYNVVVGIGGIANTVGGNSTFNTSSIVAAGGAAGVNNSALAGAGGQASASTGTIKFSGGNGANGNATFSGAGGGAAGSLGSGGNAIGASAGTGNGPNSGNGGAGVSLSTNGNNGFVYGGGGSGACTNTGANRTGGNGANGLVVISWPVISSFSASSACQGSSLTINGTNLNGAGSVKIGGVSATITSNSNTQIIVTIGSGATGTVTISGACGTVTSTAVITVNNLTNITTQPSSSAQNICFNGTPSTLTVAATGTNLSYQWYSNSVSSNAGGTIISGAISSSYSAPSNVAGTFYYYCIVTGLCSTVSSSVSGAVTIYPSEPFTHTSGNPNQLLCINNAIGDIVYTLSGDATGVNLTGSLPVGVTGTLNNNTYTISGIPSSSGSFYFSLSVIGSSCTATTYDGSIIVHSPASISLTAGWGSNTQAICLNTAINPIRYSINGDYSGLTVSGLPTGVTPSFAAGLVTLSGTATVTGSFSFAITVNGNVCNVPTTTGNITVNGSGTIVRTSTLATTSQSICINTPIINITYTIGGNSTGATVSGLPAGIAGVFNSSVFTISGSPTVSGTFSYTVNSTGSPCINPTASGTITVIPMPTVNAGTNLALCGDASQATPTNAVSINVTSGATATNYLSVLWTSSGTGSFTNSNSLTTAVYTPSAADKTAGSVTITLRANGNGNCGFVTSSKTLVIGKTITNNLITLTSICKSGTNANVIIVSNGLPAGGNGNFQYSWEFSNPGSSNFLPIAGQTGAGLIVSQANNNGFYRRIIQSGGCISISNQLHVNASNVLASGNFTVTGGGTYCSNALGVPVGLNGSIDGLPEFYITYRLIRDGSYTGDTFQGTGSAFSFPNQTIPGTYTIDATVSVVQGNSCTAIPITGSVSVSIQTAPSFTGQPDNLPVCIGTATSINAIASGTSLTYKWQASLNGGATYSDLNNTIPYSGVTSTVLNVSSASLPLVTNLYRLVVTQPGACAALPSNPVNLKIRNIWSGVQNTNWFNPANWYSNSLPDANCPEIYILNSSPFAPTIQNIDVQLNNLIVQNGSVLTVKNAILKVSGTLTAQQGINLLQGGLMLNGNAAQQVSGSMLVAKSVRDLTISNDKDVSFSGVNDTIKLLRTLNFEISNATLNTNQNLTVVSDSNGTANIADMTGGGLYSGNRILGNVTVERYIPKHAKAWQSLAVPTTGQTVNASWQEGNATLGNNRPGYGTILTSHVANATGLGFDIYSPGGASIKHYNSSTNLYDGLPSTTNLIDNPKGYMLFLRGDRSVTVFNQPTTATTLRTTGKLYTPIDNPPAAVNVTGGRFESVGNPYASAIDFSKLIKTGGVQDVFYVWDPKLTNAVNSAYGLGAYQTFIRQGPGYTVIPGQGSYTAGNNYIESGIAFLVYASGTDGTLSFSENAKVNGSYLVTRGAAAEFKMIKTNLSVISAGEPILLTGTLCEFNNEFSAEVDMMDALKINNNGGEGFAIERNSKLLAAERRPEVSRNDTLFFKLQQLRRLDYKFDFIMENMNEPGLTAFLEDKFLQTSTPLNMAANNSISFRVNDDVLSAAPDRFRIVFNSSRVLPVSITTITAKRINEKSISVSWKVNNEQALEKYEVERSADGRIFNAIHQQSPTGNNGSGDYNLLDAGASAGRTFYRIKATSFSGLIQYSKIVLVEAVEKQEVFSVNPNPVIGKKVNLNFNGEPGNYLVQLINKAGQIVFVNKVQFDGSDGTKEIALSQSLPSGYYVLKLSGKPGSFKKEILIR